MWVCHMPGGWQHRRGAAHSLSRGLAPAQSRAGAIRTGLGDQRGLPLPARRGSGPWSARGPACVSRLWKRLATSRRAGC